MPSHAISPITFYSWFPGEDFLAVSLPDYDRERLQIMCSVVVVAILFVFLLPKTIPSSQNNGHQLHQRLRNDTPPPFKRHNKTNGNSYQRTHLHLNGNLEADDESTTACEILIIVCGCIIFALLFFSNNNLFPARTILVAPVLTIKECQQLIEMAHAAAQRNAEEAQREKDLLLVKHLDVMNLEPTELEKLDKLNLMLEEPSGWKKDRHDSYPTTDLNLVTDFTPEDKAWLAHKLNARFSPLVERSFGIFRGSIRANDIFVVRYDATKGQPHLRKHKDDSHLSFNVLLNDQFQGGGTRFHSPRDGTYVDAQPDVGEAVISHADLIHEGLATTKGTRYILVGFDAIDEKDPLTGEATNLSIFSSWLSFPWMQVRLKEGFLDTGVRLFWGLSRMMLIKVVDSNDFDKYFGVMDQAMEKQYQSQSKLSRGSGYASWFRGQQIFTDVFGGFRDVWKSRKGREDKFRGEL